jgi:hypothetical protein
MFSCRPVDEPTKNFNGVIAKSASAATKRSPHLRFGNIISNYGRCTVWGCDCLSFQGNNASGCETANCGHSFNQHQ